MNIKQNVKDHMHYLPLGFQLNSLESFARIYLQIRLNVIFLRDSFTVYTHFCLYLEAVLFP